MRALPAILSLLFIGHINVVLAHGTYQDYQVYDVKVTNERDSHYMKELSHHIELDLWSALPRHGGNIQVMVSPNVASAFKSSLDMQRIEYTLRHANVQELVDRTKMKTYDEDRDMDWENYHDLETIYAWIDELEATYDSVTIEVIGKSYEGRDQRVVKICRDGCGVKNIMYIEGGIHAREWMSPAVVTYMINELTVNAANNADMLDNLDWYILPVTNPDGYEYTQEDRYWRKTRSLNEGWDCIGTDANRNFEYEYGGEGQSDLPCSDTYSGSGPASEIEITNVQNFILANKDRIKFFNDMHSYASLVLLPWGYSSEINADLDDQLTLFTRAAEACFAVHGEEYVVGPLHDTLYGASGISVDFAYGAAGIKYSTTIELRDSFDGFDPPPETIILECEEMWAFHRSAALDIIAEYVP